MNEQQAVGLSPLEVQRRVERQKDELVAMVEETFGPANQKGGAQRTPITVAANALRNVLELAMTTQSLKELDLFIRWQIARDSKKQGWGKSGFGEKLRTALGKVQALDDDPTVRVELVRLFLGYLVRHARYVNQGKN